MTITVQAPSSKSLSHRALIGAALANGTSHLEHVLESVDLERTRAVLEAAGATIRCLAPGRYAVCGVAGTLHGATEEHMALSCDMHESGTSCRLLTALLATGEGNFRIHGAPRMHERPIGLLVEALTTLGATIAYEKRSGFPPLLLMSHGLVGGEVSISMEESSQYLSGLLLAAPMMQQGLRVTLAGRRAVSWPYVGLTLQTLEDFGIPFTVETRDPLGKDTPWTHVDWRTVTQAIPFCTRFTVFPAQYTAGDYSVEGDWSGASYLLAAGALGNTPVCVQGLRLDSLQGDKALVTILEAMGAYIEYAEHSVTVHPSALQGITVDMSDCPDLVPTVAVLATCAQGTTTIQNVAHLRIKESDRIAAPVHELRKVGIDAVAFDDGLRIEGGVPHRGVDATFCTYGDHRIAMSLALLELRGVPVALDDAHCVAKSFPTFWDIWKNIMSAQ